MLVYQTAGERCAAVKNRVVVAKEALEAAEQLQEALSASLSEDSGPEERTTLEHTRHQISRRAPSLEVAVDGARPCSRAQDRNLPAPTPNFRDPLFRLFPLGNMLS